MPKQMITQALLNERMEYMDGNLYWRRRTLANSKNIHQRNAWNAKYAFKKCSGYLINTGYRALSINGKSILYHRAIYILHHGKIENEIDHRDGDKLNNHIENLRASTSSQNKMNRRIKKGKKYKGVYFNKKDKIWRAQASVNGVVKYIGNYMKERDAAIAYNDFVRRHYDREFLILNEV